VDEKKLLKYSVDYLSKYDSSKQNLMNVLVRKIFRLQLTESEKSELLKFVENIILKLEKNNLLNDNRFTMSKILSLSRSGKSKNFIFNYLLRKGITKNQIQTNFDEFNKNNNNWELNSAELFARKKKLLVSNENYEKKLAKMARAGFSYDICKKVLG
tara:strand:- start:416 stop:886 length:471 start_codon:yes stop_codon:yes gene_type:complete